jgi:hypothetical protein
MRLSMTTPAPAASEWQIPVPDERRRHAALTTVRFWADQRCYQHERNCRTLGFARHLRQKVGFTREEIEAELFALDCRPHYIQEALAEMTVRPEEYGDLNVREARILTNLELNPGRLSWRPPIGQSTFKRRRRTIV